MNQRSKPILISWNTTARCNLHCKHCYRDSKPDSDISNDLSLDEGRKLLEQIHQAGFNLMIFSGGEPLLRPDIVPLIRHASDLGLRPVVGTNGTLIDAKMAHGLKNAGAVGVGISLDSVQADAHDAFRGRAEAHSTAVDGIKHASAVGLRVQVNMTLSEENCRQFGEMADYVEGLGVSALHPFFLVPAGRGISLEEDNLKREKYFEIIKTILDKQKTSALELKPTCAPQFMPLAKEAGLDLRFTRGCLAGISYCCILPDGEVHICPYLPVKAGNIRQKPFAEIWQDSAVFKQLRDFSQYEGRCGGCEHISICGGCRARAFYYSRGNYMAADPWCYKEPVRVRSTTYSRKPGAGVLKYVKIGGGCKLLRLRAMAPHSRWLMN